MSEALKLRRLASEIERLERMESYMSDAMRDHVTSVHPKVAWGFASVCTGYDELAHGVSEYVDQNFRLICEAAIQKQRDRVAAARVEFAGGA